MPWGLVLGLSRELVHGIWSTTIIIWSTDNKRIIERVTNIKFLSFYIDECLTWTNNTDIIANKIAKNIGKIRKMAYLLSSNILSNLYYNMIYPYYTYGSIVWAANYDSCLRCSL